MRKIVLLVILLCANSALRAADIWVSTVGAGADGGANAPLRSLSAAAKRAHKGDTIHVQRGSVIREGGIAIDGATVIADGPADQPAPVVSGALQITGFKATAENAKILSAPCPTKPVLCAADGKLLTLARFPNDGFLTTKAGTTATTITDGDLGKRSGSNWKGAQLHWRKWSWWWETRTVTADSGDKLELSPTPVKDLANLVGIGSGYYVDDCRAELDAPGEWWYDAANKQLLVIPPAGIDAAHLSVEAAVEKSGVSLSNATVRGITFRHYIDSAVAIHHTSVVEDCAIEQVWDTGLSGNWESNGSSVRRCAISEVLNIGISWGENAEKAGGTVIEHNTLTRIGTRDGLGGSGTWHAVGMIIRGKGVVVRLNTLVETGYAGIILGNDGQTVEHNVFVRCMSTMNDGAAVYTNCSASIIHGNIILNTVGNLRSSQPFYPLGHGIWPEFLEEFHDSKINGNTIVGCGGNGIFMPNNFTCEVEDNVIAGNRMAGLSLGTSKNIKKAQGHKITGNVFVVDPHLFVKPPWTENIPGDWSGNDHPTGVQFEKGIDYGTMSGSTFVLAPGAAMAKADGGKAYKDPPAWKGEAPWADPSPRVVSGQAMLLINDTEKAEEMSVPAGSWGLISGERAGSTVKVEAFASAVLISAAPLPSGAQAYVLASGRDFSPGASGAAKAGTAVASANVKSAETIKKQHDEADAKRKQDTETKTAKATPKKESWDKYLQKLHDRIITAIADGRPPRFNYSAMKADVDVTSLSGNHAMLKMSADGATLDAELFPKMETSDALALSRAMLRKDNPDDHALVAFFARCAGDFTLADKQLVEAGAAAEDVKAAFAAP